MKTEPRILAALKLGPMTNAQLAKCLTLPRSTVTNCTTRLYRDWKLRCVGYVKPRSGGTYPRLFSL